MKKVAVITGASSGFGSLFASKLSTMLNSVDEYYLIARREDKLVEVSKTVSKPCKIIPLDLEKEESAYEIAQILSEDKVSVKMLINCAGFGIYGDFLDSQAKDVTGMLDLNCKALTMITKEVIPFMCNNSRIINIASSAAFLPQKNFAVYAASKSYVLSFTRALNCELRDLNIYCTAVCPGPADTNFFNIALENSSNLPFYKEMFMADAGAVVDKAIKDSIMKHPVSVYGLPMKSLRLISKIVPASVSLGFMSFLPKS